ncbi:hypothetical protein OROMI_006101 [Orobanche minor]
MKTFGRHIPLGKGFLRPPCFDLPSSLLCLTYLPLHSVATSCFVSIKSPSHIAFFRWCSLHFGSSTTCWDRTRIAADSLAAGKAPHLCLMLPSSTNMSASSSRLVDILIDYLGLIGTIYISCLTVFDVIFWVNYGWQRGRGSAVEVDGGMTVLRPEIGSISVPAFAIFGLILRKYPVPLYVELMAGRNKKLYYVSSGATIVDQIVIIAPAANYVPEPGIQEVRIVDNAMSMSQDIPLQLLRVYVSKAQDVVSTVLAKGSLSDKMP